MPKEVKGFSETFSIKEFCARLGLPYTDTTVVANIMWGFAGTDDYAYNVYVEVKS